MRRFRTVLIAIVLLSLTGTVAARQIMQDDLCVIEQDEVIEGTLFVLCQNLVVLGTVNGNIIGAATATDIRGTVANSLYLTGTELNVYGTVGDDLHYAGIVLNIAEGATFDNVRSDVLSLTISSDIADGVAVPGSVLAAGYQMQMNGTVAGEVSFWGSALDFNGTVAGDLLANVGDINDVDGTGSLETLFIPLPTDITVADPGLRVGDTAVVSGNLVYTAPSEGVVTGTVRGTRTFNQARVQFEPPTDDFNLSQSIQDYFGAGLREFVTLAVVGAFGLLFFPAAMQAPITNLRRRPLTSLGVGTLTFIVFPFVAVIGLTMSILFLFILSLLQAGTLIYAAAAVLILVIEVGGTGLFYFVAIFIARSVFCLAWGRWLLRFILSDDASTRYLYGSLVVGSFVVGFLVSLPVIGIFINAMTLFLGLGAIVTLLQARLRNFRESSGYVPPPPESRPTAIRFGSRMSISVEAPPLPAQQRPATPRPRHTVGLDNLPPGFVWWDEL
ncbi:MAG: polymer-forming cytoskeletal protein [Chloroflexota bacterium]